MGLRFLLERFSCRLLTIYPTLDVHEERDALIWVRERFDSLQELAHAVITLRRTRPTGREPIISDYLPQGLAQINQLLSGVQLAKGQEKTPQLKKIIYISINKLNVTAPLLNHVLSPGQWRVPSQMAAGACSHEISALNGIAIKTVLAHRTNAMLKLGLNNSVELAFVLRGIHQIQATIPAIWRAA